MKIDLINNKFQQITLAALILIVITFITYQGSLNNNFVDWDDYEYIVHNDLVINHEKAPLKDYFSTVVSLNYHPLTILSLSLNDNTCKTCPNGISAKPFITSNIILHILNTLFVFLLIYELSDKNILSSFLVAAIFGVHPMHVESVAWISERKDVLYGFFFLSGLLSYLNYVNRGKGKYLWLSLSFVLFVFSCLSKATAVVFPVVLLLIHFWISKTEGMNSLIKKMTGSMTGKDLLMLVPFFAVSLFFGLMAINVQGGENFLGLLKFENTPSDVVNIVGPFSVLQKFQIASYGFFVYAIKFLFPFKLGILYPYPPIEEMTHGFFAFKLWASLAGVAALAVVIFRSVKKTKLYFFGTGFFLITIILVLQLISVGKNLMAERYTYLPYIGLTFIPAMFIAESSHKVRRVLLLLAGAVIIFFMILAKRQVSVWFNSETLWSQVIKKYPDNEKAHEARGKFYYGKSAVAKSSMERVKYENKAAEDFKKAILSGSNDPDVYEGMGVMFESRDDLDNALKFINIAISLDPVKGKTYYNRAMIYDRLNDKEMAIKDYSEALTLDPGLTVESLSNRSVLYIETRKYADAINDLSRLITINSRNHMYYYNRAFSKLQLGDIGGAISDYQKGIQLNPGDQETKKQLQLLIENYKK